MAEEEKEKLMDEQKFAPFGQTFKIRGAHKLKVKGSTELEAIYGELPDGGVVLLLEKGVTLTLELNEVGALNIIVKAKRRMILPSFNMSLDTDWSSITLEPVDETLPNS